MSDEQINAAIAKVCGWENVCQHPKNPNVWVGKHAHRLQEVPDYCGDLNAMHEAEKVLTKDRNSYLTTLAGLVEVDHLRGLDADWPWVCATARQRAEAFLRTLGKWEGGE